MVLSCRLQDLCDPLEDSDRALSSPRTPNRPPGYWTLELARDPGADNPLGEWHGHVVGILGHFNRGKTWVMGRLSDYSFPTESMIIRTDGMSFKWIETKPRGSGEAGNEQDVRWHLAIDTAGFNAPITHDTLESPGKQSTKSPPRWVSVSNLAIYASAYIVSKESITKCMQSRDLLSQMFLQLAADTKCCYALLAAQNIPAILDDFTAVRESKHLLVLTWSKLPDSCYL